MAARTRLSPDDRRAALVSVAVEMFGNLAYEDVKMDDVAMGAGCSRALLYHYFPNKRTLYLAVVRDTLQQIYDTTRPDPSLDPVAQLRAGLREFFAHAAAHPAHGAHYRAVYHSASLDPEVDSELRQARLLQENRVLESLPPSWRTELVRLAVRSWTLYVAILCLHWLEMPGSASLDQITEVSVNLLLASVQSSVASSVPQDSVTSA